jgi:UDP-glucose:(heptosyl)LPS alpha-1,3-glucosyltransferase
MTPDRLRIALVVHDYNRHVGHSRYAAELATRFRAGHEVHVYANTFDEPDPAGLTYHHVPAVRGPALASVLSFVLPATLLVRGRYDVIHAQGLCGFRHDVATAHFVQPGWYAARRRLAGRLTARERVWAGPVARLERHALTARRVRRVIAVSDRVRADLAAYYGRRDGVTVIPHGVDLDAFHPRHRAALRGPARAEIGVPPDACLAVFVGNLAKGAAAAIRAVARLPGVWLALVSGSDRAADEAVARELGVADRVRFVPFSKQVMRYFAAADVFVFPTLYDPFGLVIAEAMAAGLPVVTSRAAGAADLIRDGESGFLTDDPWDVPRIAAAVGRLAADPGLRAGVGAAARAAVEPHTWDRCAAATLAVYRAVAAEKRGRR